MANWEQLNRPATGGRHPKFWFEIPAATITIRGLTINLVAAREFNYELGDLFFIFVDRKRSVIGFRKVKDDEIARVVGLKQFSLCQYHEGCSPLMRTPWLRKYFPETQGNIYKISMGKDMMLIDVKKPLIVKGE